MFRLKRDSLPRISRETGLNIVAGTAFYVEPLMPEEVKMMSVQQVRVFMCVHMNLCICVPIFDILFRDLNF